MIDGRGQGKERHETTRKRQSRVSSLVRREKEMALMDRNEDGRRKSSLRTCRMRAPRSVCATEGARRPRRPRLHRALDFQTKPQKRGGAVGESERHGNKRLKSRLQSWQISAHINNACLTQRAFTQEAQTGVQITGNRTGESGVEAFKKKKNQKFLTGKQVALRRFSGV
ncbi:hypothetical protein Q7C36_012229 [Tachysurus vachellii]|uniref:Uncharacterized protein n=1 Tax=Tachysurus vachellii TaxID=175792 RepID=A0AA88MLU0_TACVA|nr:hypothetical protein Q7C36_012229 [Tachysurus vachellii]